MSRNVEIKARIGNLEEVFQKAAALSDQEPVVLHQDDIFFACREGRLKLRILGPDQGELIFYRRPDVKGPKESNYILSPTRSPDTLRESLTLAYGQTERVQKMRTLFLAGRTRIHLDRVEGLGDFLELEVVLADGEPAESGEAVARELMEKLGIEPESLVEGAYVDLLKKRERRRRER